MDKSNLLIDFNSPTQKTELKPLMQPLIPVPPQGLLEPKEIVEPSVDPFEVPEIEPDPFEKVLKCASSRSNSRKTPEENHQLSSLSKKEEIHNQMKCENSNSPKSLEVENSGNRLETVVSSSNDMVLNKLAPDHNKDSDSLNSQNPHNILVNNNVSDVMKNISKCSAIVENDSQSQISADFSTEESLKAVIAKRVNRCIQATLNGSLKSDNNGNKPQNKRSLSFIGLSTVSDKKECDRLNKSCTDVKCNVNLERQESNASSDSSGFGPLSQNSSDVSAEGDVDDRVFKEARKLSRTFSKLAESFCQDKESDSDDDNLLTCKPRWLYADSSEDEEEKLLKDPALNLRRRSSCSNFSSPAPRPHQISDSPALLAYKSQRSLTQLEVSYSNTQDEHHLKRSISVGSQLKEVPVIPPLVASVPVPINMMKTDDKPIKLRKKNFGDVKKGPMRAVMPIHIMTKEPLPAGGKSSKKQEISPESRIQRTACTVRTPNKDNSQLNITPMASSTPNKAESFRSSENSSLLKPIVEAGEKKRRSLDGNFGSHKSRGAIPEGGAKARSNSANSSSIPRVMHVKPQPPRGLLQAPKSTSSLLRATSTQANPRTVNVPEKKTASQLKSSFNSRVLSEVNNKSPRQSKVKSAVNTISNLVRGKKTAARDKENRVVM